jgi:molybdenum cofactor guanylyltransferase
MRKLPIHGFVLAGGRSTRMGQDKARVLFQGLPMVQRVLATLAAVCEHVSLAGNRRDLEAFAQVVPESRTGIGPLAGLEAGLLACRCEWALFAPVDLPLLTPRFLYAWIRTVLDRPGTRASYVVNRGEPQPALCLLHQDCSSELTSVMDAGQRRMQDAFRALDGLWTPEATCFAGQAECDRLLTNINTPRDLELAQQTQLIP